MGSLYDSLAMQSQPGTGSLVAGGGNTGSMMCSLYASLALATECFPRHPCHY
eukprot:gene11045-18650_t